MKNKAQVSAEFMIILLMLFLLLLFSLAIFSEKNTSFIFSREQSESKYLADKIARTVNSVYLAGNGAEAKILLEKKFDYNVVFSDNAVQVFFRNEFADSALLTDTVSPGTITAGSFVDISNSDGQINIQSIDVTETPVVGDQTIPVVLLEVPASGYEDADGNLQFDYNVNDINSGIANCSLLINGSIYQTDNTISEGVTQSFTKNGMTNGSYTWDVECTDDSSNSNAGSSAENRPFTVNIPSPDTTPPVVLLESPASSYEDTDGNLQFDYNVDDSESGVAFCSLIIDGSIDQTDNTISEGVTQSFTKNGMTNGSYTWDVNCTDDSVNANVGSSAENRLFTVNIPVGPQTVTRWATTALFGTLNTTGVPDNTFDSTSNGSLAASTFDVSGLSGTISQVRVIWSHQIPGALDDDSVTLSYGLTAYNDITANTYNSGNTPVDQMGTTSGEWEYYDATSNRPGGGSWGWTDFSSLAVGGEYVKSKGPDSTWDLDAVGVEITYNP